MIFGLQRNYFVGDKIYQHETDKVFARHWLCAGHLQHLFPVADQDTVRTVQIGNYNVLVVRRACGALSAFHNVCRHRGTQLVNEECTHLRHARITCPYHAWTYATDGALLGAPNMQHDAEFDRADYGLEPVACVSWNGFVMIHLRSETQELELDFAPLTTAVQAWGIGDLVPKATLAYDVQANWKIIFQNFSECYHCPTVHPNLNQLTPYLGATNDLVDGVFLGGPMALSEQSETISRDGKRVGDYLPGLNDAQRKCVMYYTVFPSMFISAHPDYVMVHVLHRVDNQSTRVECHFLAPPSANSESLQRAVSQWDEVNRQDWQVCQLTQRGIESPAYRPGPYSRLETMLIAFDRYYRSIMDCDEGS